MQIIAISNQKGGVGKTTTTINIGAGLTRHNKKVLLVDLDPQANLTYSLGIRAHKLEQTIYELLKGETSLQEVIIEHDGFCIIPSAINLSGAEIEFSGTPGREFLLQEILPPGDDFDYILIDCPPSLGLLTLNALTAAQKVWIPVQTEFLPMQGMAKLLQTVGIVKKRINNKIDMSGIICTRYDSRKNLNREVAEKLREHFGRKVFRTMIRENVSLAEAPGFGQTVFEYKPNSNGAADYLNLSRELIEKGTTDE